MSVSTRVSYHAVPDERWLKLQRIAQVCRAKCMPMPDEVAVIFEEDDAHDPGPRVNLPCGLRESFGDPEYGEKGYVIDLQAIPKEVRFIRVRLC